MTKTEAKHIQVCEKKIDEAFTILADAEIGSQKEKDARKVLESYQAILLRIRPGTPTPAKHPQRKGSEDGFKSLI